jgi:hypothetical protein
MIYLSPRKVGFEENFLVKKIINTNRNPVSQSQQFHIDVRLEETVLFGFAAHTPCWHGSTSICAWNFMLAQSL